MGWPKQLKRKKEKGEREEGGERERREETRRANSKIALTALLSAETGGVFTTLAKTIKKKEGKRRERRRRREREKRGDSEGKFENRPDGIAYRRDRRCFHNVGQNN